MQREEIDPIIRRADYSNYNESLRGKERSEERSYFGKGPKNWKRRDERIKEDVCERLWLDSQIDASAIEVDVQEGHVYLRGLVDSRDTKRAAEYRIENISGVEDVRNELRIQL